MPLAIEPLHPMYAADRACVNTLEQALDLCDALDPRAHSGALGVAVDVYHVWWDPKLEAQIARAGSERLLAFHVCDWLAPTRDLLDDRGMMGDGVIEIPRIRGWVEAAGFAGYSEVEIFSTRELVEAAGRRGAAHLHRAASQRRLSDRARRGPALRPPPAPAPSGARRRDVERAQDQQALDERDAEPDVGRPVQVEQRAEHQRRRPPGRCRGPSRRRRRRARWRSSARRA